MKKLIILSIVFFGFLILGCNNHRDFRYYCSDNVNLIFQPPSSFMPHLCYDDRGSMDILIMNHGKTEIFGLNFYIEGELENKTMNVPILLNVRDADLLSLNFQLSNLGEINYMEVKPIINYEDEKQECEYYRIKIRSIQRCY